MGAKNGQATISAGDERKKTKTTRGHFESCVRSTHPFPEEEARAGPALLFVAVVFDALYCVVVFFGGGIISHGLARKTGA